MYEANEAPPKSSSSAGRGTRPCACSLRHARSRLVVVTGAPGAGKSAVLEMAKRSFCRHVMVLPEAASMLFASGFPRAAPLAAQRAIYFVQRELERAAAELDDAAVVLCDRGTLDVLPYWPGTEDSFFAASSTSRARELASYHAVVHLRVPAALDDAIARAWAGHPRLRAVPSGADLLDKARVALALVEDEMPACCRALL